MEKPKLTWYPSEVFEFLDKRKTYLMLYVAFFIEKRRYGKNTAFYFYQMFCLTSMKSDALAILWIEYLYIMLQTNVEKKFKKLWEHKRNM